MISGFKAGLSNTKGWFLSIFTPSYKNRGDMDAVRLLMTDAVAFHKAGASLNSLTGGFAPKNFLLCHSVELAMKAYLVATGSTLDEVENLGHDLKKLRNRCRKRGLTLTHPRANQTINMIGPVHKKHLLRYKRSGGITMPIDVEFDEFVLSLFADIWPTIRIAEKTAAN